jgi:hypothetical protein
MNEQIQPPKGTPLFNPWAPEFITDPYPFYHRLRVTDPMHLTPLGLYVAPSWPASKARLQLGRCCAACPTCGSMTSIIPIGGRHLSCTA